MTDRVSKEVRSKMMQSVKSVSKMEGKICNLLWNHGLRFRRNVKDLIGKPDICIKKYKVVIFFDSCFWHYCEIHGRIPASNYDFWFNKITRNKQRDKEVSDYYEKEGWNILRIWEHQIKTNLDGTIYEIIQFVGVAKEQKNKS